MPAFTARSSRPPGAPRQLQDQADGLRRLFAGRRRVIVPLAANPHGASAARVLDRLAALFAAQGRHVLVVDAASTSPLPHELAGVDLSACVLNVAQRVSYLAARGLPLDYIDTRGSSGAFIDAVQSAAPQAEIVLLHADGLDLARLLKNRAVRPILLGADHPESIKHAYANAKLLVRRCNLMTYDLLLVASQQSPRVNGIAESLGSCLDTFLGAVLRSTALLDTEATPDARADTPKQAALSRLLASQLALDEADSPATPTDAVPLDWHAAARPAPAPLNRPAFR